MKRLGVLGWPVAHSRSPAMHNAALRELGLADWAYQRLPVPPELFDETVRGLPGAGFVGANVTIPHKEAALALADTATPAARAIGAANTLSFADGAIHADNTDAPGLLAAIGHDVRGLTTVVLGAGGSARACAWALADAGAARVAVWNRTPERATRLAADLGVEAVTEVPRAGDVLVQCTSVGLDGEADPFKVLGLPAEVLSEYATVVDLVYRDGGETVFLAGARAAGCRTVDGLEILVGQGALSFEAWTGRPAPLDIMRKAVRGAPPPGHDHPREPAPAPGRDSDRGG
jgi:shikimate dehydrogenase